MNENFELVGTFEITSNQVVLSDPCYDPGCWCSAVKSCPNGIYTAIAEYVNCSGGWGRRVARIYMLRAFDMSVKDILDKCIYRQVMTEDGEDTSVDIGVDSGTCGFYDYDYHLRTHTGDDHEKWYEMNICDRCDEDAYILDSRAVICTSGYGDGSYDAYELRVDDQFRGFMIEFIRESEEVDVPFDWDDDDEE